MDLFAGSNFYIFFLINPFLVAEGHLLALTAQSENAKMSSQLLEWSIERFSRVIASNPTSCTLRS